MRERQPDVQGHAARLRREAQGEQHPHERAGLGAQRRRRGRPVREPRAARPRREQQHAREEAGEPGVRHHRVHPARVRGRRGLASGARAVEDEHVGGQRHELPRERERHHVRGERHDEHRGDEDGVGEATPPLPSRVADRVDRHRHRRGADEGDEQPRQRVHLESHAAERHQPVDAESPRSPEHAGDAGRRRRRAQQGGERVDEDGHQRGRPSASRRPASSAAGEGGQPGISASTGTISRTPPMTAYEPRKMPPSPAQSPAAITIFGSGVA